MNFKLLLLLLTILSVSSLLISSAAAAVTSTSTPLLTQVDSWGANSVRIRVAGPGNSISDPAIMALLSDPPSQVISETSTSSPSSSTSSTSFVNGNIQVNTDPSTGYVTITRVSDGAVLLSTTSITFGQAANISDPGCYFAAIQFAGVNATEKIVGFGQQQDGQVVKTLPFYRDIEDAEYYPYNHGSQALVGWYMSTAGYAFLWNLPSYGSFNVSYDDITFTSISTPCLDFWVTTTPTSFDATTTSVFAPLLQQYADATGHAPAMPYFATGFFQSKDRYYNQTQLLDVARGYASRGLQVSAIAIDYYSWLQLGDWSLDVNCWPNPPQMIQELGDMGIEVMQTFWPFMNSSATYFPTFDTQQNWLAVYEPTQEHKFFWYYRQWGALVDSTNPDARKAVFEAFWQNFGQYGVKAVWLDETEPDRFNDDFSSSWRLSAGAASTVGAGWKKTWIQQFSEGFHSKGLQDGEFFLLSRSIWGGTQKYGNGVWSGDVASTFTDMRLQIFAGQGVGLTGQGIWSQDIGGYTGGNTSDPTFQNLIVRWFQWAALTSVFRLHGHRDPPADGSDCNDVCSCTNGDNEVWNLAPDEEHLDAIVSMMRFREDIRNYVLDISVIHSTTAMPMIRPMFLEFPQDPGCAVGAADVEDQYMFGPSWLVAPVYEPFATNRTVYLPIPPEGCSWIYWWNQTDVTSSAGQRVMMVTPLNEFPLFFLSVFNEMTATTASAAPRKQGMAAWPPARLPVAHAAAVSAAEKGFTGEKTTTNAVGG